MNRAIILALTLIVICAGVAALALRNLALSIFAVVSLLFLLITAAGSGRIASSCSHLKGRSGTLRIWGREPREIGNSDVILERVWALGAGLHFSVSTAGASSRTHIKVAQPTRWSVDPNTLTIGDAKYVQVSGANVDRSPGSPALHFALSQPPRRVE